MTSRGPDDPLWHLMKELKSMDQSLNLKNLKEENLALKQALT